MTEELANTPLMVDCDEDDEEEHPLDRCRICLGPLTDDDTSTPWVYRNCRSCVARYPSALRKAHEDHWPYMLKLRTGEILTFTRCWIKGDYADLRDVAWVDQQGRECRGPDRAERGIDVRVSDIVWCLDMGH